MGEIRSLVCVGFLVKVSDTCALVGGAGSCLSCGVFLGVCELSMILARLSDNGWGCISVLLVDWHGASSTGICWPLGGAGS